jgi:hypothetical protein
MYSSMREHLAFYLECYEHSTDAEEYKGSSTGVDVSGFNLSAGTRHAPYMSTEVIHRRPSGMFFDKGCILGNCIWVMIGNGSDLNVDADEGKHDLH